MTEASSGCCCSKNCCTKTQPAKTIEIDFLYLDLSICGRCQGTEKSLDEAILDVSNVLKTAGFAVIVNKVNIISKELALRYHFLSSPTIRINGRDIAMDVKESLCEDCGDLCGDHVDCRVWTYEGNDYNEPPKAMIVNAILQEIYGERKPVVIKEEYRLPHNLEVFFEGQSRQNSKQEKM